MLNYIEAIILSVVQGIGEWLPISSSGHLAIVQNIFGFQNLSYDVFLHLASILAVLVMFWREIIKLFYPWHKHNLSYLAFLVIAIIPAGLIGVYFKHYVEGAFSSFLFLGVFFLISGAVIYSTRFSSERKDKIGFYDSVVMGIFQAIAILPGISRSGATISSGLFRGVKKTEVVKFSFLLAIPVILGAGLVEFKGFLEINPVILIVSFLITFAVSLFSIKLLLKVIDKEKFYLFGIYNMIMGALLLILKIIGII